MAIINKNALKDTLSKLSNTAKDTAESVVKVTKESATTVAKKSTELVEISKLTVNINSEESKIKDLYCEIGQTVYEKHSKGIYIDPDLVAACNEILEKNKAIDDMKEKISQLKNKKSCPECGNEMDVHVKFCTKCGAEQSITIDGELVIEDTSENSTCDCSCEENEPCNCECSEKEQNNCESNS
jgi:hypothetical protein